MRVHLPGEPATQFRNVVILGGVSFWSEFHFVDHPGHPASYRGIAQDFATTFRTLHALPCDIFLGAHGSYFNMLDKLERYPAEGPQVFLDTKGFRLAVDAAEGLFEAELAKQRAAS